MRNLRGKAMCGKPFKVKQKGFTLVELSIVLIIIGFIIAGVAAGQSMIKSSKLNSVIQEMQQYTTAVNNFKARYSSLPGDFNKASDIWPSCDATPANCNGNMDGAINADEPIRAFQQLSLSGLMNATYQNYTFSVANPYPSAKYGEGSVWKIAAHGLQTYTAAAGKRNKVGLLRYPDDNPFISPVDAYSIDIKIDDGNPSDGMMLAYDNTGTGCITEPDGVTPAPSVTYFSNDAIYNLKEPTFLCHRISFYLD